MLYQLGCVPLWLHGFLILSSPFNCWKPQTLALIPQSLGIHHLSTAGPSKHPKKPKYFFPAQSSFFSCFRRYALNWNVFSLGYLWIIGQPFHIPCDPKSSPFDFLKVSRAPCITSNVSVSSGSLFSLPDLNVPLTSSSLSPIYLTPATSCLFKICRAK